KQRRGGLAMGAAVQLQSAVERFVGAPVRKMLIDGKWVEAVSGKRFETINPATGQVLARVAEGDKEDIDRAVRAARRAFDDGKWARMNPTERQRLLLRIADLIEANGDELAQLETLDNGKPFKEIHRETASTLKRVSLELGGKSPNIVFSDADPEAAVQGALLGVFFCAGQVCCAGTRLFVEQKIHDQFADKLAKTAADMKQGPGLDPETRIGPLVSQEQLERVTGYLEVGKKEGAKALIGGERNTGKGLEKGYFVKPTIFTGVRNDMKIARE